MVVVVVMVIVLVAVVVVVDSIAIADDLTATVVSIYLGVDTSNCPFCSLINSRL